MEAPKPIQKLIEHFEKLPGIGPKTAQRLTFYLLHFPKEELEKFADSLIKLKTDVKLCSKCKNVATEEECVVCSNSRRKQNLIAVVANSMDAFAIENTGYDGVYHVLHGVINPLDNIGPDDIFLKELIERLNNIFNQKPSDIVEIILATNTSMEGESTSLYIAKLIRDSGFAESRVKITRIARGLPVGGDLEYADDVTLKRALEGRSSV